MTEAMPSYHDEFTDRTLYIPEAMEDPEHTLNLLIKHRNNRVSEFVIPSSELLARIDAADPDAMRAYLRERADYLDSPHDAVPEADSPEDVDEQPATAEPRAYGEADRMGHTVLALIDDMHLVIDVLGSLKHRETLSLSITRRLDWIVANLDAMTDRATDVLEYIDRTAPTAPREDADR